jgi:hypothetical protein
MTLKYKQPKIFPSKNPAPKKKAPSGEPGSFLIENQSTYKLTVPGIVKGEAEREAQGVLQRVVLA